jgi:hypothetical protein
LNTRLESKIALLESTRNALLKELRAITPLKLNQSPAPGKWSAAQVIYHLNKAESQSIIYVSKKMNAGKSLEKSGLYEWIKMFLVKVVLWSPIKYKAPVNVLGDVPENVNFADVTAQWNETREKLKTLVLSMPEYILGKKVFKQPAAGMLNIYQMLDFMQAHFNRHRKQIKRTVQ